jgi:hypothetical protein
MQPTDTISKLYRSFKRYLFHLIQQSQEQFSITLHTAIPEEPFESLATSYVQGRNRGLRELEIRVLTPAFYSRFVHYAYTSEALDRECIFTDEKNRTLWISRPQLLPLLLNRSVSAENQSPLVTRSYFDELRWNVLKKLRCAPATPAYGSSSSYDPAMTSEDVRSLPYSEFDQYVRNRCPSAQACEYRRTVTKLFLAQRLCFGFSQIIGLLDSVVRLLLCYMALSQLGVMRARITQADIGGCSTSMFRNGTLCVCLRDVRQAHGEWWWLIGAALAVSTTHLYGFLKGYN